MTAPASEVPLLDLPGLLVALDGPEHQPARVETFPGDQPGIDLQLTRCRCGRLFDAAALAAHLERAAA